jgi:hypothetical protein
LDQIDIENESLTVIDNLKDNGGLGFEDKIFWSDVSSPIGITGIGMLWTGTGCLNS